MRGAGITHIHSSF